MFGNVTALEGLHVIGKYSDISMQHTCSRHAACDPHTQRPPALGGSSNPAMKDVRLALTERRNRRGHPRVMVRCQGIGLSREQGRQAGLAVLAVQQCCRWAARGRALMHSLAHTHARPHTLTHTHTQTLSLSLSLSRSHPHTHILALSVSHTNTHSPTHTLSLSHANTLSLSPTLTYGHSNTHTLSLSLSLTHTHALTHTPTHTHTHTDKTSLSLSHTHSGDWRGVRGGAPRGGGGAGG